MLGSVGGQLVGARDLRHVTSGCDFLLEPRKVAAQRRCVLDVGIGETGDLDGVLDSLHQRDGRQVRADVVGRR